MIPLTCTISTDNYWRHGSFICITALIIQIKVQYLTTVLYCLNSRYSAVVHYVHFYRTRGYHSLFCTVSIDNHSRYSSVLCIVLLIIQIRVHYLTDRITKLNTVGITEIMNRKWLNMPVTLQNTSQNQEHTGCAVSSCLMQEKVYIARIFKIKVWRATSAHKYGYPLVISGNRVNGIVKAWLDLHKITPMALMQTWRMWIKKSCGYAEHYNKTKIKAKHNETCPYFMLTFTHSTFLLIISFWAIRSPF